MQAPIRYARLDLPDSSEADRIPPEPLRLRMFDLHAFG